MKRFNIIWTLLLLVALPIQSQVLRAQESALVYYMPQTQLAIQISYEQIEQTPGIFYQYAQRYLGVTDVITEQSTTYRITNMALRTHTLSDTTRVFKVPAHTLHNIHLLSFSEDGRLLAYNSPQPTSPTTNTKTSTISFQTEATSSVMPLLEEQFMAGSIAKMAEGAAKMIYNIRETRIHLLAGDVEHIPADGQSMQLVLQQMEQQEQELISLFVGTTRTLVREHTVYYTPSDSATHQVVARFSKYAGVVAADDLSGEPIYLTLKAYKQILHEPIEKTTKYGMPAHIYYNLPGSADVTLRYLSQTISQNLPIAQYGSAVPLANSLFIGRPKFTILFNPETGNILSITK